MKKIILILLAISVTEFSFAQSETFSPKRVVNANTQAGRLRHPFSMVIGLDSFLFITERRGYVIRMNRLNGDKKEILNIRSQVRFTTSGGSIKQDGMFGIALHPQFGTEGSNLVYLAYTYDSSGRRRVRIVEFTYNHSVPSLTNEKILVSGIHGSDDHNGGKLVVANFGSDGEPDYKLMFSCGDRGANQFGNTCDSIESQYVPTWAQIAAGNKQRYNGKILRINLDGSVPSDNPDFGGIGRSHVYSIGHRNPQGIALERDKVTGEPVANGIIYSSEQGPATNDEVNIISGGKNYGWPRVAGKRDNNWYKYYKWAGTSSCSSYAGECSSTQTTSGQTEFSFPSAQHTNPIFDLFPGTPSGGSGCNWLTNPTLAPSSVFHYSFNNKIPGWENSLLISTLKSSAVYRLKLNANGDGSLSVPDSVTQYFKGTALNRYRDIVVANDGVTFYLLTDSVGGTSGPTSGQDGGVTNRGAVLEYIYTGALLALGDDNDSLAAERNRVKIYPNPATQFINVETQRNVAKPVTYWLYDIAGRPVLNGESRNDKFRINVSHLAAGVYMLRCYNGRDVKMMTQKVIIQ